MSTWKNLFEQNPHKYISPIFDYKPNIFLKRIMLHSDNIKWNVCIMNNVRNVITLENCFVETEISYVYSVIIKYCETEV